MTMIAKRHIYELFHSVWYKYNIVYVLLIYSNLMPSKLYVSRIFFHILTILVQDLCLFVLIDMNGDNDILECINDISIMCRWYIMKSLVNCLRHDCNETLNIIYIGKGFILLKQIKNNVSLANSDLSGRA